MTYAYTHDGTTITRTDAAGRARNYTVQVKPDDAMREPWKEHDGHGLVSDWTTRDKRPGELVLSEDRNSKRFYDLSGTMKKARAEGWGISEAQQAELAVKLNLPILALTTGQITAEAVRHDFEYLRGWCNDVWHWVYIVVTDDDTGEYKTLGGLQSDDGEYVATCAAELADELLSDANEAAREHLAKVQALAAHMAQPLNNKAARLDYVCGYLEMLPGDDAKRAHDAIKGIISGDCAAVAAWLLSF